MARDSLFGERILWTGRPRAVGVPRAMKLVAAGCATGSVISLTFAASAALAIHARVGGLVLFSAWCATLALAALRLPAVWRSGVEYVVTERHVIWQRGRLRRTIDRSAISYALIRWDPQVADVGDLILVRAVPTGALRRTLRLSLAGVTGPDRLWAIVRGLTPSAPLGRRDRPLGQRLDADERVLWSGVPLASPWTTRRVLSAGVAALLALAAVRTGLGAARPLTRLGKLHALSPTSFSLLVIGVALGVVVLVAAAAFVAYAACLRPRRLARATRYFVTDHRVLIRRGNEELHLDRARIADVIAQRARGLHHLFLVLDGPQARAFAPSGAFGGDDEGALLPVLTSIEDAETVGALLHHPLDEGRLEAA